jgi:hypothetical protein
MELLRSLFEQKKGGYERNVNSFVLQTGEVTGYEYAKQLRRMGFNVSPILEENVDFSNPAPRTVRNYLMLNAKRDLGVKLKDVEENNGLSLKKLREIALNKGFPVDPQGTAPWDTLPSLIVNYPEMIKEGWIYVDMTPAVISGHNHTVKFFIFYSQSRNSFLRELALQSERYDKLIEDIVDYNVVFPVLRK